MFDLSMLKYLRVADVPAGQLVLYPYRPKWLVGLKVGYSDEEDGGIHALIAMSYETGSGALEPYLFEGIEDEKCLVISTPKITWGGDMVTLHLPGVDRRPGCLALHSEGVMLLAARNSQGHNSSMSWWRIKDGRPIQNGLGSCPIFTQWRMSVVGVDGKEGFGISFPEDFQGKRA